MCKCSQENPLALGEGEQYLLVDMENRESHYFDNIDELQRHMAGSYETNPPGYYEDPLDELGFYIVRREIKPERKVHFTFS